MTNQDMPTYWDSALGALPDEVRKLVTAKAVAKDVSKATATKATKGLIEFATGELGKADGWLYKVGAALYILDNSMLAVASGVEQGERKTEPADIATAVTKLVAENAMDPSQVTRARYQYGVDALLVAHERREEAGTLPGIVASAIGPVLRWNAEDEALDYWDEALTAADGGRITGTILKTIRDNHGATSVEPWTTGTKGSKGKLGFLPVTNLTTKVQDLTKRLTTTLLTEKSLENADDVRNLAVALSVLTKAAADLITALTPTDEEAKAPADTTDDLKTQVEKVLQATGS
jgi:hypothetical protein